MAKILIVDNAGKLDDLASTGDVIVVHDLDEAKPFVERIDDGEERVGAAFVHNSYSARSQAFDFLQNEHGIPTNGFSDGALRGLCRDDIRENIDAVRLVLSGSNHPRRSTEERELAERRFKALLQHRAVRDEIRECLLSVAGTLAGLELLSREDVEAGVWSGMCAATSVRVAEASARLQVGAGDPDVLDGVAAECRTVAMAFSVLSPRLTREPETASVVDAAKSARSALELLAQALQSG